MSSNGSGNNCEGQQNQGMLNVEYLKNLFKDDADFIARCITVFSGKSRINIMYIDGLAEDRIINDGVIMRLQDSYENGTCNEDSNDLLDRIEYRLLSISKVFRTDDRKQLVSEILVGRAVLIMDNNETALIVNANKVETGEKSEIEATLISGNEAFTDDLSKNFILLRKRLHTIKFKFREFKLGRLSQTNVRVAWIEGVVNPKLKDELFTRLERIDIDLVYSFSVITELIEDAPSSIWPQHKLTERPDVTAANLAEGRLAILCDNFPFAAIVPIFITQEFQSPDDYSQKWIVGSFIRILRYIAFIFSSTLSSIYLSIVTYNHSIMPPDLAIRVSTGRKNVPFPTFVEILLMTIVIDLLREAGIRLPKSLGAAIGVLGAVVIGQSAVQAGYVSSVVIIVIAVSAISSFAIASIALSNAARIINYFLLFVSNIFGLFGLIMGSVFILWRVVSLRSFGVSLAHPMEVGEAHKMKDIVIRAPWWNQRIRSGLLSSENKTRIGEKTKKPSSES